MKTHIKIALVLVLQVFAFAAKSQTSTDAYITETKIIIRSEDKNGNPFEAVTENGTMILNKSTGVFVIGFDVATLKTGIPKLDTILMNKGSQRVTFKSNISDNLFLFNQQVNDEKMYTMQGQLTFNNLVTDGIAQFDPVNYSDNPDVKNFRIDFLLSVDTTKIVISGLENRITKLFIIEIKGGRLNMQQ